MNREEIGLQTDIRDLSTPFYVILRRKSIESGLGVLFAIWSLDLAFHDSPFFNHSL